jgi:cobaltochelatase CobN
MADPTAIPGRMAWETGKKLGDQLLARYTADEGRLPESVAIVVYSGETIKTTGDDIAEILYLYGVRPVWIGSTSRVTDLEVIPLEELGRPRIDVTLRISGLFRDTFPNLIERIEDAVNMVAALNEDEADNFVKKHILADLDALTKTGIPIGEARELAALRVFGCPPGNYGAGVDIMVNSKKWENADDLGRVYINWSAHAYSRKLHGDKLPQIFSRRLAACDVTVKNISSHESDMLDDDDYYNYHGGLISAVKTLKGSFPSSYSTNAADPNHTETRSVHEDASRIMRARITNPQWIAGLKEHGFRGAQEFAAMVDIVFGWDATSNVIDDWMYESIAAAYVLDDNMRDWLTETNPWVLHAISERLLEAEQRGMWNAKKETLERIRAIYLNTEGELEDK